MLKIKSFRRSISVLGFLVLMIVSFSCQEAEEPEVKEPEVQSARYDDCMSGCDAQYLACSAASPPGANAHCWTSWDRCFDKCWQIGM